MSRFPTITIAVPVYNEEKNIEKVLDNIFQQNYPKRKLDVIVVDDNSTDRTVEIAKRYPVRIMKSNAKDAEVSMLKAFRAAKGEFFTFLSADMLFYDRYFMKKLSKPLIENADIPQAATRYWQHPKESLISKYLSLDPVQLDPVYRFFSCSFEETIVEKRKGYYITRYSKDKIPPQNAGVYRISIMKRVYEGKKKWMDLDQFIYLIEKGYSKFAYVPSTGYYHFHVDSFRDLVSKRLRNLNKIYLPNIEKRKFTWFDLNSSKGVLKVLFWVLCANLFLPLFVVSIYKALRDKNVLWLLDAPVALVLTDLYILNMISSDRGKDLIKRGIKSVFS